MSNKKNQSKILIPSSPSKVKMNDHNMTPIDDHNIFLTGDDSAATDKATPRGTPVISGASSPVPATPYLA